MTTALRRTVVALVAVLTVTALGSGLAASQQDAQTDSYALEQGEQCAAIDPVSHQDQSVVEFYGYTDNASEPGVTYSANTPIGLELVNDGQSSVFLYEGPEGLSLVVLNDAHNGSGGAASYRIAGLPSEGEWVVQDDPEAASVEQWNQSDGVHSVHWGWQARYTDGGAFHGGLDDEFSIEIAAAFDEDARLDPLSEGNDTEWRALSADGEALESIDLDPDESVTIRSGTCE